MTSTDGTDEDLRAEDELSIITYDSNVEKKSKKKSNKPPKSPKSPYLSNTYLHLKKAAVWRPLKGTGTMHMENPSAKVPREMWVASLRQGIVVPTALSQSLKSESDFGYSRNSNYTSTPEYLKEALGMKKPKHSRSASNGYVPGTPDYKEREDMYDEIIELKKIIQTQKVEYDILKTKLRRSEEENSKKEKQIEQLLDPSKSLEYARSLIDKKNDTSGIVNGLKKRIYKLEKQCKEKDSIVNKLQIDLKTTNIEEMKIATETYYEEIQRLRLLLADNETADRKSRAESRESQKQQKVLNSTILRLSKSLKHLQEENKSLKVDLDSGASGTAQGYNEWSKQRLVRKVVELEKKVSDQELAFSPSRANSRTSERKRPQAKCTMDQTQQQDEQHVDQQQECDRLQELVKKLKEDRSHLQNKLATRDTEVKQLTQEKSDMEKELQRLRAIRADKPPEEYRREICSLTEKVKQLEAELEVHRRTKQQHNDLVEVYNTSNQSIVSLTKDHWSTQATSASYSQRKQKGGKEQAAKTIQKHWRQYRNQKEDADMEEAITVIQASARGHLARKKLEDTHPASLKKMSVAYPQQNKSPRAHHCNNVQNQLLAEDEKDEAVSFIQSSFRAHLTRMQYLRENTEQRKGTSSARNTKETTVTVRKSRNIQPRSKYSGRVFNKAFKDIRKREPEESSSFAKGYLKDDEYSDGIEEDISEDEEQEEVEPLKKLKISPNRPLSSRSSRYVPRTSEEAESDDSDNVIVASASQSLKHPNSNI